MYSALWSSVVAMFTAFMLIMGLAAHASYSKVAARAQARQLDAIEQTMEEMSSMFRTL